MNRQWLVSTLLVLCSLSLLSGASAPPAMAGPDRPQASFAGPLQLPPASRFATRGPAAAPPFSAGTNAPQVAGDEHWAGTFTMSGVISGGLHGSGGVNAMVRYGHLLYVAGSFNWIDRVIASNIAVWDGTSWSPLGSGTNGVVKALAVDSSGNLYAGGWFTTAGGVTVNGIAKWNGSTWSALGSGVSGGDYAFPCYYYRPCVLALATDAAGNLYAGGIFYTAGGVSAKNIAKWNGSAWSAVGGGTDGPVSALTFDSSGYLYAGGSFHTAGGITVNHIARWGNNIWSPLGSGVTGTEPDPYRPGRPSAFVLALATNPAGSLYVGGSFTFAGDVRTGNVGNVAKWSGGGWSALSGPFSRDVSSLVVDRAGNLVAGTVSPDYSYDAVGEVARWNGSDWLTLGEVGYGKGVYALAIGWDGELYAGGVFGKIGALVANGVARWDGSAWSQLGTVISNSVEANVRALVARSGKVYVGGDFHEAGTTIANTVALWNGTSWSNLGPGIYVGVSRFMGTYWSYTPPSVNALAQDAMGRLYAGGLFSEAGFSDANYIAQWDGSTWSALGNGVNGQVFALALDAGGNLYASGGFQYVCGNADCSTYGTQVNGVAKWDGSTWSALGNGSGDTHALAVDASGNLYSGADYSVAKWDGTNWSPLGSGTNGEVKALALDAGGNLYAGGRFTTVGEVTVNGIAKWDGSTWSALGSGVAGCTTAANPMHDCSPAVYAIAIDGGNIYVGGNFTSAGGIAANHIAKWNGTEWSALGSGTNAPVNALAMNGTDLYVGGEFWLAGGKLSENFALWSPLPTVSNSFIPVEKNQTLSLSSMYFTPYFSDVDGDGLNKIKITALPAQGTLKVGATPVVVNQEIALSALANLSYTPPTDWLGTTTFGWTGSNGTDYAGSSATTTLMVAVWQHSYFPWVGR